MINRSVAAGQQIIGATKRRETGVREFLRLLVPFRPNNKQIRL